MRRRTRTDLSKSHARQLSLIYFILRVPRTLHSFIYLLVLFSLQLSFVLLPGGSVTGKKCTPSALRQSGCTLSGSNHLGKKKNRLLTQRTMSQDEHEGEHGPNSHALHQPQQHCRTHPTVAVDLDEVLGRTVDGIVAFHNATYGTTLSAHDFTSYNYWNVWGGTREESIAKIRAFYQSPFFLGEGGLAPVPGALAALTALKADGFRLVVVTSRQEVVRAETQRWLDQHFAGIVRSCLCCLSFCLIPVAVARYLTAV